MQIKEFSIEEIPSRFLRRTIWLIYIPIAVIATICCCIVAETVEGFNAMVESIRDKLSDLFEVALKVWKQ